MSKKLSEIFFDRTFLDDSNLAVFPEDIKTYGEITALEKAYICLSLYTLEQQKVLITFQSRTYNDSCAIH